MALLLKSFKEFIMTTILKVFGRYLNVAGEKPVDTDGRHLSFGDKIIVVGTKRNILKTHYLGVSKSGDSLMYLSAYKNHIDSTHRHYVIKYDWTVDSIPHNEACIQELQKISKQINEELGIDLYA